MTDPEAQVGEEAATTSSPSNAPPVEAASVPLVASGPATDRNRRWILVLIIVMVLVAGVGIAAFVVGRNSSSASSQNQSHPATVSATLPVVACRTSYGLTPNSPPEYGRTMKVTVPVGSSSLALYTDAHRQTPPILGPRGWACSVSIGVDGSTGVYIYPHGEPDPNGATGLHIKSDTELIEADSPSACQGCTASLVCSVFPSAINNLGYNGSLTCPQSSPHRESRVFLSGSAAQGYGTVKFIDPAKVAGTGADSGGTYPATGVVSFGAENANGSGGQADRMTCVLPPDDAPLCRTIVNHFVSSHWLISTTLVAITPAPSTTMTTVPASQAVGGAVPFTTPDGYSMTVSLTGVTTPTTTDCLSNYDGFEGPCENASTDNLAIFNFSMTNTGNSVIASYEPDIVYAIVTGPSGNVSDQLSAPSSFGFEGLLPGYAANVSSAIFDVPANSTVTSVILVPYASAVEPFPTWNVNVVGSDSWCSQVGNPSPCGQ